VPTDSDERDLYAPTCRMCGKAMHVRYHAGNASVACPVCDRPAPGIADLELVGLWLMLGGCPRILDDDSAWD